MIKKSIIIRQPYHKEIVKLSEAFDRPIGRLTEDMITYFKKTGINPKDALNQNPSTLIKKLDNRIISFLKVQERDILMPIRNDLFKNHKTLEEKNNLLINGIKNSLINLSNHDKKRSEFVVQNLQNQKEALLLLAEALDPKNKTTLLENIKSVFK
mgnify:CR=1 FL=1